MKQHGQEKTSRKPATQDNEWMKNESALPSRICAGATGVDDILEASVARRTASRIVAIVLAFVMACSLVIPQFAWADDDNQVNPQQLPDSSFIYDTSIQDLSTADAYYDEQTVQVVGEVIGDSVTAEGTGAYRWVTLISQTPETNATIMVFVRAEDAEKIDSFGRYGVTGTMLRVRGTYHLTCEEHEGLSDVHADYVSVVKRGSVHHDTFDIAEFIPGGIAVVIGLLMLIIFYRIRERRR